MSLANPNRRVVTNRHPGTRSPRRPALRPVVLLIPGLLLLTPPAHGAAQVLPVLDADATRLITQEVSGDAAYETVRTMTQWHRGGGTPGLWRSAEYIAERAREVGLEDVRVIRQAGQSPSWSVRSADLWIEGDAPERIASTLQSRLHLADYSRAADVTAELVDVGAGTPEELDAAEVAGKVVLTYGPLSRVMAEAVGGRGAAGVVWYPDPYSGPSGTVGAGVSRPDQLRWNRVPVALQEGEPTWAFGLSLRQGIDLHNRLVSADEPVMVRARVDAAFDRSEEPWQVMTEAFLRGTDRARERLPQRVFPRGLGLLVERRVPGRTVRAAGPGRPLTLVHGDRGGAQRRGRSTVTRMRRRGGLPARVSSIRSNVVTYASRSPRSYARTPTPACADGTTETPTGLSSKVVLLQRS